MSRFPRQVGAEHIPQSGSGHFAVDWIADRLEKATDPTDQTTDTQVKKCTGADGLIPIVGAEHSRTVFILCKILCKGKNFLQLKIISGYDEWNIASVPA